MMRASANRSPSICKTAPSVAVFTLPLNRRRARVPRNRGPMGPRRRRGRNPRRALRRFAPGTRAVYFRTGMDANESGDAMRQRLASQGVSATDPRGSAMRAAVLLRPGELEQREAPVPQPGAGELVVRVEAALTCGTDVKTFQRGHPKFPLPSPLGHEFSGVVVAAGAGVRAWREGDAIALVPTAPCGVCRLCRRGRESVCPDAVGRMLLGAFAEYVRVPAHIVAANVFARPAGMAPEVAAALEPLACVVHGADRVALDRAESVVLVGDGSSSRSCAARAVCSWLASMQVGSRWRGRWARMRCWLSPRRRSRRR